MDAAELREKKKKEKRVLGTFSRYVIIYRARCGSLAPSKWIAGERRNRVREDDKKSKKFIRRMKHD